MLLTRDYTFSTGFYIQIDLKFFQNCLIDSHLPEVACDKMHFLVHAIHTFLIVSGGRYGELPVASDNQPHRIMYWWENRRECIHL